MGMNRARAWAALGFAAISVGVFFILPPIPQSPAYHQFADQRAWLGVPRFLDVFSNAGFLIVGAWGLAFAVSRKASPQSKHSFAVSSERRAYCFFFLSVFLTAFGSAYYHLAPDDARLVWDRLPMAVGFMALLAAVISERVDARLGSRLLAPLIALGIGSVLYWRWTALRGHDDLRLYGLVQFGSGLAVALLAIFWTPRYTRGTDLIAVAGLYVLAKLSEWLDRPIFALGNIVSGHTLKHLAAAVACYWVLRMLKLRTSVPGSRA
jgi:hypothetical protein